MVKLAFEERGSGPPLLLVHGFPLTRAMWRAQVEALSSRAHVIACDLRGMGESEPAEGTTTIEQFADDLVEFLDLRGVTPPVALAGLSMGGYVALQFAKRHPDRLARLALIDTRAGADTPDAAAGRRLLADKAVAGGMAPLLDAFLPKLLGPKTLAGRPGVVADLKAMVLANQVAGCAAALRGMAVRPDMKGFLPSIRVPTLVLVGADDAISTPAEMKDLAAAIPGSTFVVVQGAGHMTPMEDPAAVNAAMIKWLEAPATS